MDFALFGKNVKKYRTLAGLKQAQLSEMASCSLTYLGQIENGKCNPGLEVAVNIANALGVSVDLLVLEGLERPEIYMTRSIFDRISNYPNKQKILIYEVMEKVITIIEDTHQSG